MDSGTNNRANQPCPNPTNNIKKELINKITTKRKGLRL